MENLPCSLPLIEALLPYFVEFDKSKKLKINQPKVDTRRDERSIVVTSDWHIPFQDNEVIGVFLDFLAEYQPDELILNGNINDCTSFSSHPRIRELANTLRDGKKEREAFFHIAELLRLALPNTKIVYIGSQCHEGWIDQWVQSSPILVDDVNYTIPGWFRLGDFNIDYIPEVYDVIGNGSLLVTHGTIARSKSGNSAHGALEAEGTSVIVGHTHRLSQVYRTTSREEMVGIECGCLCQRTPWYTLKGKRRMMDWQQGFVLLNVKQNSFSAQCIPIIRDGEDKPYFWVGKERYGCRNR
jgi:predicted phosphodiesterase